MLEGGGTTLTWLRLVHFLEGVHGTLFLNFLLKPQLTATDSNVWNLCYILLLVHDFSYRNKEMEITIINSLITGLHATKNGSHPSIALEVVADNSNSAQLHDRNVLKVVCPLLENIPRAMHDEVVWPRNPASKRYEDVLVSDVAGLKVGNVPANLCGLFKELLMSGLAQDVKCFATANKPRRSTVVPASQSFRKGQSGGRDRRGGGVVLDCKYVFKVRTSSRASVLEKINAFLVGNEGQEAVE